MGQPGTAKKRGRTVLEKRRIKQEKVPPVKRRRKSSRLDAGSS